MESYSRRKFAPSPDGTFRESKWFYERARGQYQDARSNLTPAQRHKFDLEYPRSQVFSKTDLAKFLNLWRERPDKENVYRGFPDIVSKGAQKNFADFAGAIGKEWSKQSDAFNETYFRHAIAKAIIFRDVEKLVTKQPWYQGGYRANIVAHAIAKLATDVERLGRAVDFDIIWKDQAISKNLSEALTIAATAVHSVITDPQAGMHNVTEWAKTQACWSRVMGTKIEWPAKWRATLLTTEEQKAIEKSGAKDQKMVNGIEAQIAVVNAGGDFWRSVKEWNSDRQILSPTESEILDIACAIPTQILTDKQSSKLIEALKRLRKKGCQLGLDII